MEPGLFPHPAQLEPGIRPDPDGRSLGGPHRLLDSLVELLGVEHEHVHGVGVLLRVDGVGHHGRLHGGHHPQLCPEGWNFLANLIKD